jgi:hypothetical protein
LFFRRHHLEADQFLPNASAFKKAVPDEDISRCGQKTDHIRQPCQTDDDQEIDKRCSRSARKIRLPHWASSIVSYYQNKKAISSAKVIRGHTLGVTMPEKVVGFEK